MTIYNPMLLQGDGKIRQDNTQKLEDHQLAWGIQW